MIKKEFVNKLKNRLGFMAIINITSREMLEDITQEFAFIIEIFGKKFQD